MNEKNAHGARYIIGIDLGGTKIATAIFKSDSSGKIELVKVAEKIRLKDIFGCYTDAELTPKRREELIIDAVGAAVHGLLADFNEKCERVGICSAGFVEDGIIVEGWNMGVKNFALRDMVSEKAGLPAVLIKDSWAPVYALQTGKAAIVFSIGTGLGAVSCNSDHTIPLKSFTANRRLRWLPHLYCNDDPGYAISFSEARCAEIITRSLREIRDDGSVMAENIEPEKVDPNEWGRKLMRFARESKRITPSRLELFFARLLAPEALAAIRHDEIYADFTCSADLPSVIYEIVEGRKITPPELDALFLRKNAVAVAAFRIQAGFLGYVFHAMQMERITNGFPPVRAIYGTGSGYNSVTHVALSEKAVDDMQYFGRLAGYEYPLTGSINLIESDMGNATFACCGAAAAAYLT